MKRTIGRREAVRGIGVAAVVAVAGCAGSSGGGGDGETTESDGTSPADGSDGGASDGSGGSSGTTDGGSSFRYTFSGDDDVAGSSLTGVRMNYPDGSGAVADAAVDVATLGGDDVTDDLDGTSTSNNGTTLTADFGGAYDIAGGDELVLELSGVSEPDGSYTVETVVNPQSGATGFETSF